MGLQYDGKLVQFFLFPSSFALVPDCTLEVVCYLNSRSLTLYRRTGSSLEGAFKHIVMVSHEASITYLKATISFKTLNQRSSVINVESLCSGKGKGRHHGKLSMMREGGGVALVRMLPKHPCA